MPNYTYKGFVIYAQHFRRHSLQDACLPGKFRLDSPNLVLWCGRKVVQVGHAEPKFGVPDLYVQKNASRMNIKIKSERKHFYCNNTSIHIHKPVSKNIMIVLYMKTTVHYVKKSQRLCKTVLTSISSLWATTFAKAFLRLVCSRLCCCPQNALFLQKALFYLSFDTRSVHMKCDTASVKNP